MGGSDTALRKDCCSNLCSAADVADLISFISMAAVTRPVSLPGVSVGQKTNEK